MTPSLLHTRTLTLLRPTSPPPYTPPYHPDPSPSPSIAGTNTLSCQTASPIPGEIIPGGSGNLNTGRKTPDTAVFKRQTILNPSGASKNCSGMAKCWQQVENELPKELLKFFHDITENIMTYDQLVDFAIKCDIPISWVERAKEDYPHDSKVVINKVFFEWWDRCNLNVGKKLQMIQSAFVYMGKPLFSTEYWVNTLTCKY